MKRKNKNKYNMYPDKIVPMQFNDPVSVMPMCGEGFVGFNEWIKLRDKKFAAKKKRHWSRN